MGGIHDLNPVLETPVDFVDIVGMHVQVDLATLICTKLAAGIEHEFAVSE
jgi:hypothetical protein